MMQQQSDDQGFEMGGVQMNSGMEPPYQNMASYQRSDSYRSYYEPTTTMIEPPRKRLICQYDECSKTFQDQASLKKHQLTHGEKNFMCKHPSCGKKFLDNSKLKRHLLVHTGEKPFSCKV